MLACCTDETEDSYQALKYSYHRSIAEMGWKSVGEVLATGIWGTPDKEKLREACKEASGLAATFVDISFVIIAYAIVNKIIILLSLIAIRLN